MKKRALFPVLLGLLLASNIASPEGAPDAGGAGESMPLLGPVPEEKTKPPTLAEWNAAPDIYGKGTESYGCKLRRVREWLRFRCVGENGYGIDLVSGTPTEIAIFAKAEPGSCKEVENLYPRREICKTHVEAVFPIRRGDRRFFEFLRLGHDVYNPATGTQLSLTVGATLSAAWVEDEPSPVVVMMQYED